MKKLETRLRASILISALCLLTSYFSKAAEVQFNTADFTGQPLNNPITVTPLLRLQGANGIIFAHGAPLTFTPIGGTVTTNLVASLYNCAIQGVTAGFVINVPDNGTNVYDAFDLRVSGLVQFSSTNLEAVLQFFATNNYAPGSGIAFTTNLVAGQPVITISATNAALVDGGIATNLTVTNLAVTKINGAAPGTAAWSNAAAFVQPRNNGADFSNLTLTRSNLATLAVSNNPIGPLPLITDTSSIIGAFPGQMLVTEGSGGGGSGHHQLFTWNSNSGTSNWDGGLEIPGRFLAYAKDNPTVVDAGGDAHWFGCTNDNNNVLGVQNLSGKGYSAIDFIDNKSNVVLTVGYGNANNTTAKSYAGINYIAPNLQQPLVVTDANGYPKWGTPGAATPYSSADTFGDFVRYAIGATNVDPTNVVFRVQGSGEVDAKGSVYVTNGLTVNGNVNLTSASVNITGVNTGSGNFGQLQAISEGTLDHNELYFSLPSGQWSVGTSNSGADLVISKRNDEYSRLHLQSGGNNIINSNLTITGNLTVSNTWIVGSSGLAGPTNSTAPGNTSAIRAWINLTNGGTVFKLPLYQ